MTGTLINVAAILAGSLLGLAFGRALPERTRETIISGLGLFTILIGVQMFLETQNAMIVLGGLLVGGLLGEGLKIERGLNHLGLHLEARFGAEGGSSATARVRFVRGFMTTSLLFIIGPMAILGAIQDGLMNDYQLLAIKAILDGFASFAFASTLGLGVLFSAPVVLIYQGGISLLAAQIQGLMTTAMTAEMTATGGVLLVGLAVSNLLEMKEIRVGNFLPGLVVSPVIVFILSVCGVMG
jgi:uncharacterized membrane protein YqgA involved in biofilm formation